MRGITPFLWFDDQAEEAANRYVSIFSDLGSGDSKVRRVTRYGPAGSKAGGRPEGSVMTVEFRLDGQDVVALNGGPEFRFSEAVSLVVNCETQDEVDGFWERLSDGGEEGPCGWLKDRYGFSWQIVPIRLNELLADEDAAKAERAMAAMLQMKKIDIDELERAAAQA
jgi:predicted 3-demethylubiquinone-9 3-methyltransferase (glyoxalase superfamily)